jgi:sulfoxide reductase heme-binding subunit YedZ
MCSAIAMVGLWWGISAVPVLAVGRFLVGQPSDDPTLWYVTRGAAATAYVLLTLSVALGLTVSMRAFDGLIKAWRILDLHQVSALLMLAFVVLHLVTLVLDPFRPFTLLEVLWPLGETYRPVWVGLGVLSVYLLVAISVSSWLRRAIGNRTWRVVHLTSFAAFVLLTLHGIFAGSDTRTPWMLGVYCGACALVGWLTLARLVVGRQRIAHSPLSASGAGPRTRQRS